MEKAPERLVKLDTYLGLVLRQMAKDFPENGFLGMDITFKRVVKTVKSAKSDGLNNLGTYIVTPLVLMRFLVRGN